MPDGTEPIDPKESIYRRVFEGSAGSGYYNPLKKKLSGKAFKPLAGEVEGISVTRSAYIGSRPELAAAGGYLGSNYYVVELRAGDIQMIGLEIRPDPIPPDEVGHALIPKINPDDPAVQAGMQDLRQLPFKVHGPFPGSKPRPPAP